MCNKVASVRSFEILAIAFRLTFRSTQGDSSQITSLWSPPAGKVSAGWLPKQAERKDQRTVTGQSLVRLWEQRLPVLFPSCLHNKYKPGWLVQSTTLAQENRVVVTRSARIITIFQQRSRSRNEEVQRYINKDEYWPGLSWTELLWEHTSGAATCQNLEDVRKPVWKRGFSTNCGNPRLEKKNN